MALKSLTEEQASRLYAALTELCGAWPGEDDIASFVHEFTSPNPTGQYRFQGGLGFGGKFRFPMLSIDCYPEDLNPVREAMMLATNKKLRELRDEIWPGQKDKDFF